MTCIVSAKLLPAFKDAEGVFACDTEFISFTLIITCIVSAKLLPASKDAEGVFAWVKGRRSGQS
jgi:hypothetical protein